MNRLFTLVVGASLSPLVVFFATCQQTSAQEVLAGLDLLETRGGHFDLEDLADLDLLCPGCFVIGDPVIPLKGVPLDPFLPPPDLGGTDTIIRRLGDTTGIDPFPSAPPSVPIEIVELHLQSVEPFQVNTGTEIQQWILDITLEPNPQPQGAMQIQKNDPNGGNFNSFLPVLPRLTFTRVDGFAPLVIDDIGQLDLQFDAAVPWVYSAPSALTVAPGLVDPLGSSNFVPGVNPALPNVLGQFSIFDQATGGTNFLINVSAAAAVPEPSTFALATLGLLSLGMTRRRRRE